MRSRAHVQIAAAAVGAVFLLVGILGFVPGITTSYDDLGFAGHHGAELLGLFEVNVLHNLVHLTFGIAGLALARNIAGARAYLVPAAPCTSSCSCTAWWSTTAAARTSSP